MKDRGFSTEPSGARFAGRCAGCGAPVIPVAGRSRCGYCGSPVSREAEASRGQRAVRPPSGARGNRLAELARQIEREREREEHWDALARQAAEPAMLLVGAFAAALVALGAAAVGGSLAVPGGLAAVVLAGFAMYQARFPSSAGDEAAACVRRRARLQAEWVRERLATRERR